MNGIHPVDLLRFNWKPRALRILIAALADPGPASTAIWAVRSGVDHKHIVAAVREIEQLGVLLAKFEAEGLRLLIMPEQFWHERTLADVGLWSAAWRGSAGQGRLSLNTEESDLKEALADVAHPRIGDGFSPNRGRILPESGTIGGLKGETFNRYNVSTNKRSERVAPDPEELKERVKAFVGERDFLKYWAREPWSFIFEDPSRAMILDRCLNYLQAGIRSREITIHKTPGRALWDEVKRALAREGEGISFDNRLARVI